MKPLFKGQFDGLLNIEQDRAGKILDKNGIADAIECLFASATDADYVDARILFWATVRGGLALGADLISPFSAITKREVAVGAVEYTIPVVQEFTVFVFAQSLKDVCHSNSSKNKLSIKSLSQNELTNLGFDICGALKAFLFPGSWNTNTKQVASAPHYPKIIQETHS